MVSANGANHCSASPPMNATGTKTTTIENVVAATARPISSVPSRAAVTWSLPISTCRTMFSRTTIASSIRMPIASDRPSSDIVFSVNPNASTAMNDAMTEIGSAMPVMTVERHEFRNRNTTSTVRTAPSTSAYWTSPTDCATRVPASRTMRRDVSGGSVGASRSTSSRIAWATLVVLYPFAFTMSMPTASEPSKMAAERASAVPSRTTATSPRRTRRPFDSETTSRSKSAGVARRPRSRMVRSSSWPSSRPTGAERFCACSAPTTWATPTPAACSALGRSSTVSSRSTPPTTVAWATPAMPRSRRTIPGSAISVSAGPDSFGDDSTSETTGRSAGSKRVSTGSSISGGRSLRTALISSRICWVASCRSFSYANWTMNTAKLSSADDWICDTPLMPEMTSSTGSMTSRSTFSGAAPG